MMRKIRHHATYANVAATLALVLAVGGGSAYALQGRNTVFSNDIAPNEVKAADAREASFKLPRVVTVRVSLTSTAPGDVLEARAKCPKGYSVTGGGFAKENLANDIKIIRSAPYAPQANHKSWIVFAEATAAGQWISAHAICERGRTSLF